jgi:uncharacterized protein YjcR
MRQDDMTTDDVAAALGVQPGTVRQWRTRGKLRSSRQVGTGRHAPHLYDAAEVARFKAAREAEATKAQAEAQIRSGEPAVSG